MSLALDGEEWDKICNAGLGHAPFVPETPPWPTLIAFSAAFVSLALGYDTIAVGNERSANEGQGTNWYDIEVNHQYDKSFAFEKLTNRYIRRWIDSDIWYFSALQHLWEVQIAKIFCTAPFSAYHPLFMSCNLPEECTRWCSRCPKCAFLFVLLSGFMDPSQVSVRLLGFIHKMSLCLTMPLGFIRHLSCGRCGQSLVTTCSSVRCCSEHLKNFLDLTQKVT